MHVILSGYYGFDNAGDEAILHSIISALRIEDSAIKITVLSNNPPQTKKTFQVESVHRQRLAEVNQVMRQADGLISGGGSLFQDITSSRSLLYYAGIIQLARFHKVPVCIYAQGIGPLRRLVSKRLVSYLFNRSQYISVRDRDSKAFLQTIGVKESIQVVPDPVLGLRTSFPEKKTSNTICVAVRAWRHHQSYKKQLAICLDALYQQGYTILFLPMHGQQDYMTSVEIQETMHAPSEVLSDTSSFTERLQHIHQADVLIGMRLHALIFAAITATPFVALSYDPKIDAIAKQLGQPVVGHVEKLNWTADSLLEHVQMLLDTGEEHRRYRERIKQFHQGAQDTASSALDVFKMGNRSRSG
ncbi:polysaccharide pyruvyl transferase CsaB [Oceanobacillus sp. J11TS1]|uniref:polysaccharide pyruvyl transferase CsaB n=1 Tax=Oceanobacillus sp. J11TS1 TaxID=2807191 RepID=UPI001B0209C8|nr:polysaccharide pyruvyl transferase CsaB [Oceanobacillus sp. J11TS1]GIO23398.1 polysaccharide pyruvyl transferase CsaB [Oceanobacillus sp. J11TS1]